MALLVYYGRLDNSSRVLGGYNYADTISNYSDPCIA